MSNNSKIFLGVLVVLFAGNNLSAFKVSALEEGIEEAMREIHDLHLLNTDHVFTDAEVEQLYQATLRLETYSSELYDTKLEKGRGEQKEGGKSEKPGKTSGKGEGSPKGGKSTGGAPGPGGPKGKK